MKYKDKTDGHEIRAVQNHPKFKEECLSFMGDDGCVKEDDEKLWIYIKSKEWEVALVELNGWIVKDDRLDERISVNGYAALRNSDFREMYEPIDDPDFDDKWRVYEL